MEDDNLLSIIVSSIQPTHSSKSRKPHNILTRFNNVEHEASVRLVISVAE